MRSIRVHKAFPIVLTFYALQISVSEDVDAQINQDALAALKQLLEIQPQLHHTLFTEPEHKAGNALLFCCISDSTV